MTFDVFTKQGVFARTWVIRSNHDKHLERHLTETDWKSDVNNAELFLELNLATVRAMKSGDHEFSVFEHALRICNPKAPFTYVKPTTPLRFISNFYQKHGDVSMNGAPGSITSLERFGVPLSVGDKHTAYSNKNVIVSFANIDPPPYVEGDGTWSKGVSVEQPDGFTQMVPIFGDKYRA